MEHITDNLLENSRPIGAAEGTKTPLISVIIPIYKVEKYLKECVDSVLAQTYTNLQIILVDDGSPDDCGKICDEYAQKDSRVVVIHKENGGLSDARNAGLEVAKGDYISFVDSDDIVHPDFLSYLYLYIKDADISVCGYKVFNDGEILTSETTKGVFPLSYSSETILSQLFKFKYPMLVIAWNKLYKKVLWEKVRFPFGRVHEDEFVIHELLELSSTINVIDAPLYYYRQRSDSIMAEAKAEQAILDKLEAYGRRRKFFITHKLEQQVVEINREILYRCLMRCVTSDNLVWQSMGFSDILFKNNLPKSAKMVLCVKKISYSMYSVLLSVRRYFLKERISS